MSVAYAVANTNMDKIEFLRRTVMVANQMMQLLLEKIDVESITASKEYPISENRNVMDEPYWSVGHFWGFLDDHETMTGKALTDLEWDGNEVCIEISEEIDELLKGALAVLNQWKVQMAADFHQYEFDIILSIDYGMEDVTPSATIRFYCIRDNYRIVEKEHQNMNNFIQPVLVESVGGTGIYSNDVAETVRHKYIEFLEDGLSNEEAMHLVFEKFEDCLHDNCHTYDLWFALADTQSSIGRLHPKVKEFALKLIEDGGDEKRWVQSGNGRVSQSGALERQKVLVQLKDKLLGPQPPEKKIVRKPVFKCPWKIGDLFAYRLENKTAVKNGLAGRYVIIQKVKEIEWERGSIMPMVLFRMSATDQLPGVEEAADLEIVETIGMGSKIHIHKDVTVLESKSLSSIPSKLIFLGNSQKGMAEFEDIEAEVLEYRYSIWETLENNVIRDYKYTIKNKSPRDIQ
jgi:hypothetical protein